MVEELEGEWVDLCEATIYFPGFLELPLRAREEFLKLFKKSLKEYGWELELALEQGEIVWKIIFPEEAEG